MTTKKAAISNDITVPVDPVVELTFDTTNGTVTVVFPDISSGVPGAGPFTIVFTPTVTLQAILDLYNMLAGMVP